MLWSVCTKEILSLFISKSLKEEQEEKNPLKKKEISVLCLSHLLIVMLLSACEVFKCVKSDRNFSQGSVNAARVNLNGFKKKEKKDRG